jgi:hypothetical protein
MCVCTVKLNKEFNSNLLCQSVCPLPDIKSVTSHNKTNKHKPQRLQQTWFNL